MPYTAPHTIAAAELVTTTTMNTEWGGNVAFLANPPYCSAYRTTSQSVANGTFTAIQLDLELGDTASMHSTSVNNSRIVIVTAGLYKIDGAVSYAGSALGERYTQLQKNGAALTPDIFDRRSNNSTGGGESVVVGTTLKLAAGDYLEIKGYQTTGGALNCTGWLSAVWVGLG